MKIKTYQQAKIYLESFIPDKNTKHKSMQLARMKYFCGLIGNPQNKYPIIHITGTAGKGSTATYCAAFLQHLGLKTGLHTSPHLQSITERFQVNNQNAQVADLIYELNLIIESIESMKNNLEFGLPTYFEILTAITFNYFAHQKVDAAVIEVGLGGKLDATNIILPSLAILTNISLDHTNLLGKTTTNIVKDKMMIIKPSSPGAVSAITQPHLKKILIEHCQKQNVKLKLLNRDFKLHNITLGLLGEFQKTNFTLAYEGVKIFLQKYYPKLLQKLDLIKNSVAKKAFIPGRMEIVAKNPLIILDGAHNPGKIKAVIKSLKNIYKNPCLAGRQEKWITVLAIKKGKPYKTMVSNLQKITQVFIFTTFSHSTDGDFNLATNPNRFKKATNVDYLIEENSNKAISMAKKFARKYQLPILVTGSLYLIGEVRNLWFPVSISPLHPKGDICLHIVLFMINQLLNV